MAEPVQVNLRVDSDQKERWEDYVDDTARFNSVSGLIRAAVEAEIQRDDASNGGGASPAFEEDVAQLLEEVSEMRRDIDWLRRRRQDEVDVSDLAQDLYDILPVLPDWDQSDIDTDQGRLDDQKASVVLANATEEAPDSPEWQSPFTAEALAEELGSKPNRVRDAFAHLEDQFMPVTSVEYRGETHYFREE